MKKIKITLMLALLVSAISFTSCGKKHCHKPHGLNEKPGCPPPFPPPPPIKPEDSGE